MGKTKKQKQSEAKVIASSSWKVDNILSLPSQDDSRTVAATGNWGVTPIEDKSSPNKNEERDYNKKNVKKSFNQDQNFGKKTRQEGVQKNKKPTAFQRAKSAFEQKKQGVVQQKAETARLKKEGEEKRKVQIEHRKTMFKVHNKKTKHGQPVMAGRIEKLLQKIQNS